MSVSFPTYRPTKANRDVVLQDVVMRDNPARPYAVEAGVVIGPDTLLVVDTASPLTVRPAVTGEPTVPGTNLVGVSVGYATSTATLAGEVLVYLKTENTTVRMKLLDSTDTPVVGERYAIDSSTTDLNGYPVQLLDTSAPVATSNLLVVEFDAVTLEASVQVL